MTSGLEQAEKALQAFGHGKTAKIILLCDGQNGCPTNPVKAADSIHKRSIPVTMSQSLLAMRDGDNQLFSSDSTEYENRPQPDAGEQYFLRVDFNNPVFNEPLNKPINEMMDIKIFSVGFQVNTRQQQALDKVAQAGGGKSVSAKDVKELTEAFDEAIKDKTTPKPTPKPKPEDPSGWEIIIDY